MVSEAIEQRGCHFGIAEDTGPFAQIEVCGDDEAVIHPSRGPHLLMCADLPLRVVDIIRLFGLRFKVGHSFKGAAWSERSAVISG
jgi:hypothetical protein